MIPDFDSGARCLDFVYTGPTPDTAGETLREPADLGRWLAQRWERVDAGAATARELADARLLRSAIARVAVRLSRDESPDPDDVDSLNVYAATPDVPPTLPGGRRQAGASRLRSGQALASLARDAVALFGDVIASGEPRIRECSADDCAIVFYDDSRTNNRRWCSMQRCGNRAKVRAHRERAAGLRAAAILGR